MITAIIVNHNGKNFLKKCIESIRKQTLKDVEIIVSDTDSTDESYKLVSTYFPEVRFMHGPNKGYGYACNRGADMARGDYLAFFNEDMILPPDYLEKIYRYHLNINTTNRGITATYIVDRGTRAENAKTHPGKIDLCGFPVDSNTTDSVVMPGCPFFIDKKLYKKTGGFNENIFLYGEDVDYSWRLKIFGYQSRLYTGTFIFHYGNASGGNSTIKGLFRILTSGFTPAFCNFGPVLFILSLFLNFVQITVVSFLLFIIRGFKTEVFSQYLRFLINTKTKLPQLLKMRKFVQKNRKVSDWRMLKTYVIIPAFIFNKLTLFKERHRVV